MPDDLRIRELVENALESGMSPEAALRDDPELLPYVRERRQRFRRVEALLDDIFPEPGATSDHVGSAGTLLGGDRPEIPGYEIEGVLGAAAWASSTRPGTWRLNRTGRPEDDPGRRPRRAAASWRASAPRRRRWRGLQHPNIVQIYEVGEHDGQPYFALEFVEGGSLASKLAGTPLPAREAAAAGGDAGAGDAARPTSRGVVHRDLKPANVLLDGRRHAQDHRLRPGPSSWTATAARRRPARSWARRAYMAPEQAVGGGRRRRAGGGRLRAGRDPLRVPDRPAAVQGRRRSSRRSSRCATQEPVPPSRLQRAGAARPGDDLPEVPAQGAGRAATPSAAELADDLRRFRRGEPILARPVGPLEAPEVGAPPARLATLLLVSLVLAAILGGGGPGCSSSGRRPCGP